MIDNNNNVGMKMEFGIEKCTVIDIVKGQTIQSEGVQLPDGKKHEEYRRDELQIPGDPGG